MKNLSWMGLLLASSSALAANVEITSFYYTGAGRTAEICGRVTGAANPLTRVTLTIDPGSNVATYVAWPDARGSWCALVNSQIGRAQAAVDGARPSPEVGLTRPR